MIKALTKSQLERYFADYRSAFPDWAVEDGLVLVRSKWPIVQRLAFQALRSGAYRPSCSVETTIAPAIRILPQLLDIKHRDIRPLGHASRWRGVVAAMEEQFRPAIRKPLDAQSVLRLAEEAVARDKIENVNEFSVIAALNAFEGDMDRALVWCARVEGWMQAAGPGAPGWALERAGYTRELRKAIEAGQVKKFFDRVSKRPEG
jgi:hypothetical protein